MRFDQTTRMRRSSEFSLVRRGKKRVARGPVGVAWRERRDGDVSRVGLAVRRMSGGAVGRNRVRRVLRAQFQLAINNGVIPTRGLDVVLSAGSERGAASGPRLGQECAAALRRLGQRLEEESCDGQCGHG